MDRLWAPWRINYVKNHKKQKACIFCKAASDPRSSFVVSRNKNTIAMLNIFPYNNGHMLISPIRHVAKLSQLKEAEITDLFRALNETVSRLDKVLRPGGYNIGINISGVSGAGVTKHLHIHVVPRWKGDTNFMATVSNTKIISQSLDALFKQLKNAQSKRN